MTNINDTSADEARRCACHGTPDPCEPWGIEACLLGVRRAAMIADTRSRLLDYAAAAGARGEREDDAVASCSDDCVAEQEIRAAWRAGAVERWREGRRAIRGRAGTRCACGATLTVRSPRRVTHLGLWCGHVDVTATTGDFRRCSGRDAA